MFAWLRKKLCACISPQQEEEVTFWREEAPEPPEVDLAVPGPSWQVFCYCDLDKGILHHDFELEVRLRSGLPYPCGFCPYRSSTSKGIRVHYVTAHRIGRAGPF